MIKIEIKFADTESFDYIQKDIRTTKFQTLDFNNWLTLTHSLNL